MSIIRLLKGQQTELIAETHLCRLGYQILHKNWKTPWAQVDLVVMSKDQCLWVVEVKSVIDFETVAQVCSTTQQQRLLRAATALSSYSDQSVGVLLVCINPKSDIKIFELHSVGS